MKRLLVLAAALPALAQVELLVTFGVLQKAIAAQVLENPRLSEADGRLVVRAKFRGRSAMNVLGQCVGLGDSFDVVIRMTRYADKSILRLRDIEAVSDGKRGLYPPRCLQTARSDHPRVFRPGQSFRKPVDDPSVQALRVSKEALVLQLGLTLTPR